MNLFFKPQPGVIGDCIPFFSNGRYHIFYLRDYRDRDSYGPGSPWEHISTTDFVHWEDHGVALPKGRIDEQDLAVATGCAFTDDQGKHHIFYTGINPYFRDDAHHEQALLHATSDDLNTWTKVRGEVWYADESLYERHDWRDPFVFKHPQTGRYTMVLAARLKDGPYDRRGCTGLLTSADLKHWTVADKPFYAPGRYHGHECPDWFKMGDWYYLVFSEYSARITTRYVMSRSPDGPWTAPGDNQFDDRAFYAAKSASDGARRFLFGWNPTRLGDVDHGEWQWGGCLTVHEILQNGDGTLSVRLPAEVDRAFGGPEAVALERTRADWKISGTGYRCEASYEYSMALSPRMPETYLLQGEIEFERNTGTAGILLRMDEAGNTGYFLRFDPARQRLEFGKAGQRPWSADHMPELDRPLAIHPSEGLRFKIVVDKTAVVAYVADRVALSGRMYSNPLGCCGLFVDGTEATVNNFDARTLSNA